MKTIFTVIVYFSFSPFFAMAQCPTNVYLNTQAEIDNFPNDYPNCKDIPGLVRIRSNQFVNDITNLNGLSAVETIGESLKIESNPALISLSGLDNVVSVGGILDILENDLLTDLSGLNKLESVWSIQIDDNPSLNSLNGLDMLITANGINIQDNSSLIDISSLSNITSLHSLQISRNDALPNLNGLENIGNVFYLNITSNPSLTSISSLSGLNIIDEDVQIADNIMLTSLNGLNNVTAILGNLNISHCPALTDLSGLGNLISITGDFIFRTSNLQDLSGLDNLVVIGGDFVIEGNGNMSSLDGLTSLAGIYGDLTIINNAQLTQCAAQHICDYLTNPAGAVSIWNNSLGCQTQIEVSMACGFSTVSGKAFADLDCDGSFSGQDIPVPFLGIEEVSINSTLAYTNQVGEYITYLYPNFNNQFSPTAVPGYTTTPTDYSITTGSSTQQYIGYDFGLCPNGSFDNFKVTIVPMTPPRPGFSNQYQICLENRGSQMSDADMTFSFTDPLASNFVTITDPLGNIVSGTSFTLNLLNLPLFTPICLPVTVDVGANTPLGYMFCVEANVTPVNFTDIDPADNIFSFKQEVVGSFDPNDKSVNEEAVDFATIDDGVQLEYLIRFQNTGTFPATFVNVMDTLDNLLDPRSLKMIAASHPYTLSISTDGVLQWNFSDIYLPDSTNNEPESHGYIFFRIKTLDSVQPSDIVRNRAAIYFDFNEPVITNKVTTSFFVVTDVEEHPSNTIPIHIFPNPVLGSTTIHFTLVEPTWCALKIQDNTGRLIQNYPSFYKSSGEHFHTVDLSNLLPGNYFLFLSTNHGTATVRVSKQ